MKIKLTKDDFNKGLEELKKDYLFFAPKVFEGKGTYSDTDLVKYDQVHSFEEMEFDKKSSFSPKEVMLPINQVLFYFTEDDFRETREEYKGKKVLIFLKACDLNAVKRIDQIYLYNGPQDIFYKRIRDRIKFVLVGCRESYRNCFCVSMDSNIAENYNMAMNIRNDSLYLDILDEDLKVFEGIECEFDVDYVTENQISVNVPEKVDFNTMKESDIWEEYDSRCIGCGRCNFSCPTCTCFSMQDIFYKENENSGERRRVWASCQIDGYTNIAGGHSFRMKQGERMRFKTMHKIHDFKERFGYNMCVGCGRCDDLCPQYISFSVAIDKVNEEMKKKNKSTTK